MRWLTFRDGDGERTGVLSGDAIHARKHRCVHPANHRGLIELLGHSRNPSERSDKEKCCVFSRCKESSQSHPPNFLSPVIIPIAPPS